MPHSIILLSLFLYLETSLFFFFWRRGAGNDYKQRYLSNCNRPLYLAGVINAFTAIIPLPLHVHMSDHAHSLQPLSSKN